MYYKLVNSSGLVLRTSQTRSPNPPIGFAWVEDVNYAGPSSNAVSQSRGEILLELQMLDLRSIRALRENDTPMLDAISSEVAFLRSALVGAQ